VTINTRRNGKLPVYYNNNIAYALAGYATLNFLIVTSVCKRGCVEELQEALAYLFLGIPDSNSTCSDGIILLCKCGLGFKQKNNLV
jgi:hypothetical protein